jgi:hypothetical protein
MWVVSFRPWPLYPQGKSLRYPLDRKLGCWDIILVPQVTWLDSGFWPRSFGFSPERLHVRHVVRKVALKSVYFEFVRCSYADHHSTITPYLAIAASWGKKWLWSRSTLSHPLSLSLSFNFWPGSRLVIAIGRSLVLMYQAFCLHSGVN